MTTIWEAYKAGQLSMEDNVFMRNHFADDGSTAAGAVAEIFGRAIEEQARFLAAIGMTQAQAQALPEAERDPLSARYRAWRREQGLPVPSEEDYLRSQGLLPKPKRKRKKAA